MNKNEISLNARRVWGLLINNSRWNYMELKRRTGLRDNELGAALGWLAHEEKVEFDHQGENIYVFLTMNVYIG